MTQMTVQAVLKAAGEFGADDVMILCSNSDGDMRIFTTLTYAPDMLWVASKAKAAILEMDVGEEETIQ